MTWQTPTKEFSLSAKTCLLSLPQQPAAQWWWSVEDAHPHHIPGLHAWPCQRGPAGLSVGPSTRGCGHRARGGFGCWHQQPGRKRDEWCGGACCERRFPDGNEMDGEPSLPSSCRRSTPPTSLDAPGDPRPQAMSCPGRRAAACRPPDGTVPTAARLMGHEPSLPSSCR